MKIKARFNQKYPKVFDVIKNVDERVNDNSWLRAEIKHWCNTTAKNNYAGFSWPVKSVRKVYQKPHFEVMFSNGKTKLFIIHQTF